MKNIRPIWRGLLITASIIIAAFIYQAHQHFLSVENNIPSEVFATLATSSYSASPQTELPAAPSSAVTQIAAPSPTEIAQRDTQRVNDLAQVQNALKLYYAKCHYYPGTAQPGKVCGAYAVIDTWAELEAALLGSNLGIASVPNDPLPKSFYFYGAGSDGVNYVLGAMLEDRSNPVLSIPHPPIMNGVRCAASVYCVHP